MSTRTYLHVPFAEKDEAKALGARWDPDARLWYAPSDNAQELDRWLPRPPLPVLLPGEDREFGTGLFVDLIPSSCWFSNVRSCVDARDWERIRKMVYERVGHTCEACGATQDREAQIWIEAHERWHYDEKRLVQSLRRLVALCTPCHESTHFGLATVRGNEDRAAAHLATVNKWDTQQVNAHITQAFSVWKQRSSRSWELDLSLLTDAGINVNKPPAANDRKGVAAHRLQQRRGR